MNIEQSWKDRYRIESLRVKWLRRELMKIVSINEDNAKMMVNIAKEAIKLDDDFSQRENISWNSLITFSADLDLT